MSSHRDRLLLRLQWLGGKEEKQMGQEGKSRKEKDKGAHGYLVPALHLGEKHSLPAPPRPHLHTGDKRKPREVQELSSAHSWEDAELEDLKPPAHRPHVLEPRRARGCAWSLRFPTCAELA